MSWSLSRWLPVRHSLLLVSHAANNDSTPQEQLQPRGFPQHGAPEVAYLLWDVAYGDAGFAAGGAAETILVSEDGLGWSDCGTPGRAMLGGVTDGDSGYVAVGAGGVVLRSGDACEWEAAASGTSDPSPTGDELFSITNGSAGLVAVAGVETILFSTDGLAWSVTRVGD